ncbi:hypothetical protein [Clostridium sp.]|uniref:hypothetical protein n=1 Tax=Clostridium sp. TaxID=1506 RepID=UPI00284FB11A|nr:hypothetical protein [Clostridium sp.]MDR3598026.1 hypothetical protein [Clostridium sp.]
MKEENKHSKYSFLLPISIMMLLPPFVISFIQQGNIIDKIFFFATLLGYIFIIMATVLGHRKNISKNS